MVKRFHETGIWDEDWFIALPKDYREFWFYIKDKCDHAGLWKPNITTFNKLFDAQVETERALSLFNSGKQRVRVLPSGRWFIEGFISFQYGGSLNPKNRVHKSIIQLLRIYSIDLSSISGQFEVKHGVKDKDKDKVKDKDKDSLLFEEGAGETLGTAAPRTPFEITKPDFVDQAAWDGFVEMRRRIKKPLDQLTERGFTLFVQSLEKLRAEGNDPNDVLNQSVANNWQGIFPLKKTGGSHGRPSAAGAAAPVAGKY